MHDQTRRLFLLAGLGFLAGCATTRQTAELPRAPWGEGPRPRAAPRSPDDLIDEFSEPPVWTSTLKPSEPSSASGVLSRSRWASAAPVPSRMNRMSGIHRITVHHDGMSAFTSTLERDAGARIDAIRRVHQRQGWGDVGYHYIIDPAGRVWEGRPLGWQGAHVRDHNEGNVGMMLLGNYELQSPTRPQIASLTSQLRRLMTAYRVPVQRLYTHLELGRTLCPGRSLQAFMVEARRGALT